MDEFAEKIDLRNSTVVLQYGAASQKKVADFSSSTLENIRTKDLGEVGEMVTGLVTELKSFDATEEAPKGIMGFFRKATNSLDTFKAKYAKVETNVDKIEAVLEGHQVQLLKDIAMLDKMYEMNLVYFKELTMYILAGKKKLAEVLRKRIARPDRKGEKIRPARGRSGSPRTWTICARALKRSCTIWS